MKHKTIIIISLVVLLTIVGVWWSVANNKTASVPEPIVSDEEEKSYSSNEVAQHSTKSDCWTIIGDSVYDLTAYVNRHPGGEEVLRACGQDASQLFEERRTAEGTPIGSGSPHSPTAEEQLAKLKIGTKL